MRISDWSSDVCSSDLQRIELGFLLQQESQDDQTVAQGAGDDRSGQPAELIGNHVVPSDAALLAIVFGIGAGMYGARRSDKPHSVRAGHLSGAPVANDIQAIVGGNDRSEEHTSELQSLMRISYAVFCLKKKKRKNNDNHT